MTILKKERNKKCKIVTLDYIELFSLKYRQENTIAIREIYRITTDIIIREIYPNVD